MSLAGSLVKKHDKESNEESDKKLARESTKKLARELTKKLVRLISCLMRSLMKKMGELRRHRGARWGGS